MKDIGELEFWSNDRRFGLKVVAPALATVLDSCSRAADSETGGILIGHYSDLLDCAIVTRATGPGRHCRAGGWWFERSARGLRGLLARHWRKGLGYYLGEWHYHPGASPQPSGADDATMRRIAADPASHCLQPVLLIIGGAIPGSWTPSAHVYPVGERKRPLI